MSVDTDAMLSDAVERHYEALLTPECDVYRCFAEVDRAFMSGGKLVQVCEPHYEEFYAPQEVSREAA